MKGVCDGSDRHACTPAPTVPTSPGGTHTPALPLLAWLPNLVVAEVMIRRRRLPGFGLVTGPPDQLAPLHGRGDNKTVNR